MSKPKKIKLPPGLGLIAGTILQPDKPTSDEVKEQIYALCLDDNDGCGASMAVQPLVKAYSALLEEEWAEEEAFDIDTTSEGEKVYREFAIKGWREVVGKAYPEATKSRDDSDVYECCDWYEFGETTWPTQLIAEVGYLQGVANGHAAVAMSRYAESRKAKEHGNMVKG
jgi:hypothetical protein